MKIEILAELIEYLQGTCKTLIEGCEDLGFELEDLSDDDLMLIDSEIFLCETCGWWYEICDQIGGENECENCHEENN